MHPARGICSIRNERTEQCLGGQFLLDALEKSFKTCARDGRGHHGRRSFFTPKRRFVNIRPDQVHLVQDQDAELGFHAKLSKDAFHDINVLGRIGVGDVHHVEQ